MAFNATNLKTLRVQAGLSIERLAVLATVGDLTIRGLEDNALARHAAHRPFTVTRRDADAIAAALGTDLETLGAVDVDLP